MPTRRELEEAIAVRIMVMALAEALGQTNRPEYSLLRWEIRELRKTLARSSDRVGRRVVSLPLHQSRGSLFGLLCYSGVVDRRLEMDREFTGKSKEMFRVNVTITRQRMVEHVEEGWVPLPGEREQQLNSRVVREFPDDKSAAIDLWEALAR